MMDASELMAKPARGSVNTGLTVRWLGLDGLVFVAALLIFAKDYFIMTFGIHTEVVGIFLLFILSLYALLRDRLIPRVGANHAFLLFYLATIWGLSFLFGGVVNVSSYYASFFVATMLFLISPGGFLKAMLTLMICNVAIQVVESVTGNFLFIYIDDSYEYDEKMLSVGDDSLRAKGFFASPLNAISVVMSLAFLNPRSYAPWILLCLTAALGQGRLGLGVGILGLFALAMSANESGVKSRLKSFGLVGLVLAATGFIILFFGSDQSTQRLSEANSADNSQNLARIYFWTSSIAELMKFDLVSHLFGKYGYIKALIGGTESDWLRLWLDNGFLFLLSVLIPLLYGLARAGLRRQWMEFLAYGLLILVMAVYPHGQSLPNGILMWLTVLATIQGRKKFPDVSLVGAR